jgi:hypothetical protein
MSHDRSGHDSCKQSCFSRRFHFGKRCHSTRRDRCGRWLWRLVSSMGHAPNAHFEWDATQGNRPLELQKCRMHQERPRDLRPTTGVESFILQVPRVFVAKAPRPGATSSNPYRDQDSNSKDRILKGIGLQPASSDGFKPLKPALHSGYPPYHVVPK